MEKKLARLKEKCLALGGIKKGSEFLIPPSKGSEFVDELQNIEMVILGLDGWYYVDKDSQWIVQDLSVDFSVDESIIESDEAVSQSAAIVKDYIANQLPDQIDFVSFTLNLN